MALEVTTLGLFLLLVPLFFFTVPRLLPIDPVTLLIPPQLPMLCLVSYHSLPCSLGAHEIQWSESLDSGGLLYLFGTVVVLCVLANGFSFLWMAELCVKQQIVTVFGFLGYIASVITQLSLSVFACFPLKLHLQKQVCA